MIYAIGFPKMQSAMSGVAYLTMTKDRVCVLHYTDGKTEQAKLTEATAALIIAHVEFQQGKRKQEPAEVNLFSIVSEIQSHRK